MSSNNLNVIIAHCNFTNEHYKSIEEYIKANFQTINPNYTIINPTTSPKKENESRWAINYTLCEINKQILLPKTMAIISKTVHSWMKKENSSSYYAPNVFPIEEQFKPIEIIVLIRYYNRKIH